MDKLIETVVTQGLTAGAVFVVMGFAIYKLYNRNQQLHDTLQEIGREAVKSQMTVAAALNRLSDSLQGRKTPETF